MKTRYSETTSDFTERGSGGAFPKKQVSLNMSPDLQLSVLYVWLFFISVEFMMKWRSSVYGAVE